QPEMVEQRPLRLLALSLLELNIRVARLQAAAFDVEAQLRELGECPLRIRDTERDVVEVVGDPVVHRDERERNLLWALELAPAIVGPLNREVGRELRERLV